MKLVTSLFFLAIILTGCFKTDDSPEAFIEDYAQKAAAGDIDQDDYEDYLKGDLLAEIESLEEKDFEDYSKSMQVKNLRVEILNKNCEEASCTLTYLTKYSTDASDGSTFDTEVRKIAQVEQSDGWKLVGIKNVKTYHETNDALNPLQEE